ncbi:MAG: TetR/AcrR family transcriptional regulator [Lachnospiraceae bacterium]|nr:TetR/AcrR family transcriptional regulator [Lachnospiraceae bacterium]
METRKEQKERRRQEILYTALELFVSKGYAATKITDIAKQADMSRGLMFHYFESKEKLYEELIRMGLEGTMYPGEQKCEHAIDFFTNFTKELFAYMIEQPMVAKFFVLMAEAQRSEATPEHIREIAMRVNVIEQFVSIVEWGQQEGTIKDGEPLVISNAFWCSIQGIAERYATNQDIPLPEADWVVDIIRKR